MVKVAHVDQGIGHGGDVSPHARFILWDWDMCRTGGMSFDAAS